MAINKLDRSLRDEGLNSEEINMSAAFYGWVTAMGAASLLLGLVVALGAAVGLTTTNADTAGRLHTVGWGGGILYIIAIAAAFYAGGYVAERLAFGRPDGTKQGIGVWVAHIIAAIVLAILGVILGANWNLLAQLDLPRIAVHEGSLTTGGWTTLLLSVLAALAAAIGGARSAERYRVSYLDGQPESTAEHLESRLASQSREREDAEGARTGRSPEVTFGERIERPTRRTPRR